MGTIDIPLNMTQFVVVAFLIEALIQTIKPIYDKEKGWNKDVILALIIGILICMLTSTDVFSKVGLPISVPFVGTILTGMIASRGSNIAHDLFKWVQGLGSGGNNEATDSGAVG